jgi:hypothetical protein
MSRCDIDFGWTSAANGASLGWMGRRKKGDQTSGRVGDLRSRLSLEIARIASLGPDDLKAA